MKLNLAEGWRLHEAADLIERYEDTSGKWQGALGDAHRVAVDVLRAVALPALTRAEVYEAAKELRLAELEWCQAGDLEGGQYMAAFNRVGEARKALDAAVARVQEVENG